MKHAPHIVSIHIAPRAGAPMEALKHAQLRRGVGIVGDRYAETSGTFSNTAKDHELTLIEAETILHLANLGLELAPGETRRNITTHGIGLNELVGKEFLIGSVRCLGLELCQPCRHLEKLLQRPGLAKTLINRGGLRAAILNDGVIHLGDSIEAIPTTVQTEIASADEPAEAAD
jgi:MOSC domain-containing protein YiiM